MIVLISFLVGTTDALSMPSFQSIIPSLVSSKDIPRAVALNSTQFNLSRIIGPAIAGIAIARFGAVTCFGANAISYIPFFLSLYWIYPKRIKIHKEPPQQAQPMTQFQEFKKLLTSREVRTPLLTVLVTSLFCSPIITFCPVLIKDIFHSDVEHFGGAMAAFGVGGLIGAALGLFNLPKFLKRDKVSTATAIFLSLVTTTIAFNRSQVLLLGLLVLVGIALTVSNVFANSFLQETSGNHIRGRVVSLFQLALHGGISIGALLTGFTVAQFGISKALIINGVIAGILQIANGLSLKRTS
jgi:predicted MFS family arabinose efflux permease